MAGHVNPSDFKEVLIVLGAAGVVVPLVHRLRVSPVLGFLLVGIAVGPSGLGALTRQIPWLDAVAITDAAAIVLHPAVWTRGRGYAASLRSDWFQATRAAAGLRYPFLAMS